MRYRAMLSIAVALSAVVALFGAFAVQAATRTGIVALDPAVAVIASLPPAQQKIAAAAHVSQEDHWTLVNAAGEAFTAATPEELKRGWAILLPDLTAAARGPEIYLTEDTVFARRKQIALLPPAARLWLIAGGRPMALVKSAGDTWLAQVRPHLLLTIDDGRAFSDAVALLERPLERGHFRLLAIEPGGPRALSRRPRYDRATQSPLIDPIDPDFLGSALSSLHGQTALVVARLDGGTLSFKPAAGAERTLDWRTLSAAATEADANLLVIKSASAQQPGGRNWLWQTFEVKGLDDALKRATLADALDALAAADAPLAIDAKLDGSDRMLLDVHPAAGLTAASWSSLSLGGVLTDAMSTLAGKVSHQGALANLASASRQAELDRRIVPLVPSVVQWIYGGLLLLGLAGWPVARGWWARIWPQESAADYDSRSGYLAARATRELVFAVLFVPFAALLSAPRSLAAVVMGKGRSRTV